MDTDPVPFLWTFNGMQRADDRSQESELYHIYTARPCVYGTVEKYLFPKEYAADGRLKMKDSTPRKTGSMIFIEHLNSQNSNAMKNHYLLTQIADLIMQLYLA